VKIHDVLPILQIAVGPVILVSGVALLLLTMTNRLGRILDRAREIARTLREEPSSDSERLLPQLNILERRARLVRMAIAFATTSVLLAALLVITVFMEALFTLGLVRAIGGLFMSAMVLLIVSLVLFLKDINLSLAALELEIEPLISKSARPAAR
jgi:Protein of unknown function (DUF2721)